MDPQFGFTSPALRTTSKPGLSTSRIPRRKKPTPAQHSRSSSLRGDPGFNPFRSIFETGSVPAFGVQRTDDHDGIDNYLEKNAVADEMRKLRVDNEFSANKNSSGDDPCLNFELLDEMGQLNIENDRNMRNFGAELPNEIKKLNIQDHTDGHLKKFSDSILPNKLKNLNISQQNDNIGGNLRDKGDFVVQNGENVDPVLEDAKMLKKDCGYGKYSDEAKSSFSSYGEKNIEGTNLDGENHRSIPFPVNLVPSFSGAQGECVSGPQVQFEDQITSTSSSSLPSTGFCFQSFGNAFQAPSQGGAEKKVHFSFTSKWDDRRVQNEEFKMLNIKGNLNSKAETKRESAKGARSKKKKGKLKKPPVQLNSVQDFFLENLQGNDDFGEPYSPMDISPYKESLADDVFSRETSVASDEPIDICDNSTAAAPCPAVLNDLKDEDLSDATDHFVIHEYKQDQKSKEEECTDSANKGVKVEGASEESISGAETESFISAADVLEYSTDSFITAAETLPSASDTEVSSRSNIRRQDNDAGAQFNFSSNMEEIGHDFIFAASPSAQNQSSNTSRLNKKKNPVKIGYDSYSTSNMQDSYSTKQAEFLPVSGNSTVLFSREGAKGNLSSCSNQQSDYPETVKNQEAKKKPISSTPSSMEAKEACEKWRLRGNQAYRSGDLCKAEDCYTQGVNSVSEDEKSKSCLEALMLCYSNRAATRMSLGRLKEALEDCSKAAALDPSFLKVQVRAANCYLSLGEIENASLHFMKCLQAGNDVCADRKVLVEASEGLERVQRVSVLIKQCVDLLQRRTSTDTECALGLIDEALVISPYAEKLLEKKADALLKLQKYEDVIKLCQQNLDTSLLDTNDSDMRSNPILIPWRWSTMIQALFYVGRLEEALDFVRKQEGFLSLTEKSGRSLESLIPFVGIIQELLRHKMAGNEAFQSGRYAEAVECYTAAVICSVESRPFAAICFCNRAAAYRAMGQITDAIADCSLAIALDGNYLKAFSRRAALFEMIRDYGQAATDLERIISLLNKKLDDKNNASLSSEKINYSNELKQTQFKLSQMEEAARKEVPLNMYLILGVDHSAAASEIKKAYRRAALRHHPDKAGQTLARTEYGDDALWKEIAEEAHKDADRLFKMIGEAYAVLSDPSQRSQYDLEEETRNALSRGSGRSTYRTQTDHQSYPYERSRGRWQESWRRYGNTQPKGPERSRSNWYP